MYAFCHKVQECILTLKCPLLQLYTNNSRFTYLLLAKATLLVLKCCFEAPFKATDMTFPAVLLLQIRIILILILFAKCKMQTETLSYLLKIVHLLSAGPMYFGTFVL
jgi:hypothetical protein